MSTSSCPICEWARSWDASIDSGCFRKFIGEADVDLGYVLTGNNGQAQAELLLTLCIMLPQWQEQCSSMKRVLMCTCSLIPTQEYPATLATMAVKQAFAG